MVSFTNDYIFKDGKIVGRVEKFSGMAYVYMYDINNVPRAVARYKYRSPLTRAKAWTKFILKHYTPVELIEILNRSHTTTPAELAEKHGYEDPVIKKLMRESKMF